MSVFLSSATLAASTLAAIRSPLSSAAVQNTSEVMCMERHVFIFVALALDLFAVTSRAPANPIGAQASTTEGSCTLSSQIRQRCPCSSSPSRFVMSCPSVPLSTSRSKCSLPCSWFRSKRWSLLASCCPQSKWKTPSGKRVERSASSRLQDSDVRCQSRSVRSTEEQSKQDLDYNLESGFPAYSTKGFIFIFIFLSFCRHTHMYARTYKSTQAFAPALRQYTVNDIWPTIRMRCVAHYAINKINDI